MQPIRELQGVDARRFRDEVVTGYEPVVLRGLVADWPAVRAGQASPAHASRYLAQFDKGRDVDAILMPPQAGGEIGYDEAMDGFNFVRNRVPVSSVIEQLSRYARFEHAPAVAVQSALIAECLPGFGEENVLDILEAGVAARIWIGNRVTVPAHFDESDNVACVVAGRRRFTLFPPEQVENLYIGPLDFAPTGAAMSMARLSHPDLQRFPRLPAALAAARQAELAPGDAIFIPTLWWHHVQSLDREFNVLVNYWWNGALGAVGRTGSAMQSLLHALLNVRSLPPERRAAWASLFRHYVFEPEPGQFQHIPAHRRGVLDSTNQEARQRTRELLLANLKRDSSDGV
jgi:hypothetical protein